MTWSYSGISLIAKSSIAKIQCGWQTVALCEFLVSNDALELYFLQLSLSKSCTFSLRLNGFLLHISILKSMLGSTWLLGVKLFGSPLVFWKDKRSSEQAQSTLTGTHQSRFKAHTGTLTKCCLQTAVQWGFLPCCKMLGKGLCSGITGFGVSMLNSGLIMFLPCQVGAISLIR